MALSVFEDGAHRAVRGIGHHHPPIAELWHFGGSKYGWSLRLKRRDRIVLYMIPQRGHFLVGLVLGDKALEAIKQQDLPADILAAVANAPRYGEGTGVRLPVATTRDVRVVEDMAAAKMAF